MADIFDELFERRLRGGDKGQHQHGAIAIRVDKSMKEVYGFNQIRGYNKSIHAELDALRKCPEGIFDLYIGRLNKGCSCPCKNCIERMLRLRKHRIFIRHIYYTDGIDENGNLIITKRHFSEMNDNKDTLHISKSYRG